MALVQVNWKPEPKTLRSFGLICLVFFGGVGTWIHFRHGFLWFDFTAESAVPTARVLWGAAAACGLVGLVYPKALLPLYWLLTCISLPIGFVLSHLVMALLYYGVFTPVALLFRAIGRDALERKFEPKAKTYWVKRRPVEDRERYFRQY